MSNLGTQYPLFVRRREAAAMLAVSLPTFLRLENSGKLPPRVQLGRVVVYRTEDLVAFVRDIETVGQFA